jgi:hypothetical protein
MDAATERNLANGTPLTPPPAPRFQEYGDCTDFTAKYLAQYYGPPAKEDETVINQFIVEELQRIDKQFDQYVEIGCGPTIHHAVPFARHAQAIHMTEYLPDNRGAVEKWFTNAPDAFKWEHYIEMSLRAEGIAVNPYQIARREQLMREKIATIDHCDVRKNPVLSIRPGLTPKSVVGCFYVTEEVGTSIEDWQQIMTNIASTLPIGCRLFMSALKGMKEYVMEKNPDGTPAATLPCAPVEGHHFTDLLPRLGFGDIRIKEHTIAVPDCDVNGLIVVSAQKVRPVGVPAQ